MIRKHLIYFVLAIGFLDCKTESSKAQDIIKSDGVLIVGSSSQYYLSGPVKVLNDDNSVFVKFYRDKNEQIVTDSDDSILIRAYYPDYDIIIFDANQKEDNYQVFINDKWKKIERSQNFTYKKWEEFISKIYVGITDKSPLRTSKDVRAEIIENHQEYYYEVINVEGDWLQVQCWTDCEGCPEDKVIKGWVRWKEKNRLLIELYYIC